MLNPPNTSFLERLGAWVLAGTLCLVPVVYGSGLADPFAFVKRSVMLAAVFVLAGCALGARATAPRPLSLFPVAPLAIVLLVSASIASVLAFNRGLALWGLLDLAVGVGLFLGAVRFARDERSVSLLLRANLLGAACVALGSLVQVLVPAQAAGWLTFLLPPSRGGSTLGDPGLVSMYLAAALPLGVGAAALSRPVGRQVCGALLGIVAAALLFVGRPEGWLAGGAALVFLAAARILQAAGHERRWADLAPDLGGASLRAFLIAAIVVLLAVTVSRLTFLYPSAKPVEPLRATSLLSPTTGDPAADRAAAVPATLTLIRRHPLGVGPALFRHAFLEVAWTGAAKSPFSLTHQAVHAGNGYLETTAETGIVGGLALALLVLAVLARALAAATRSTAPWDTAGTVAFAAVATLAGIAFLGAPFHEPSTSLLFWVAAGMVQTSPPFKDAPTGTWALAGPWLRNRPATVALAVVWLTAGTVSASCVIDRARASMWTLQGQGAFYAGQYRAALQAFGMPSVVRSPDHLPRAQAATSCLRLGMYDQAVREFGETLRRSPYFISAFLGRASAEEAQGHWDPADADYKEALRLWPKNPDIYLALASLNTARGRLDDALDDYREVMIINPEVADTYFRIGEVFMRRNQVDEAIEAYRICGMKNPKYPGMRLRLGDAFFQKGLQDMALRYYQAAANDDNKSVDARLRIANAFNALGEACDAKDALEEARDLETDTARRDTILDLIKKVEPVCRKQGRAPKDNRPKLP